MGRESNSTSPNLPETLDMNDKGKRKRVMESDTFESNKSAKIERTKPKGGSVALVERIDNMVQIICERNNSSKDFQAVMVNMLSCMSVAQPKYSDTDAISKLCSMSEFDFSSPKFYYACTLIEDPQKGTILLDLPHDQKRIEYIRYMYAQHKGSKL
ncbi:unnamed protein product [Amaranthus hypochondriacus]